MAYAESTEVPVERSRAEIEKLLQRHKCARFGTAVDYDPQCSTETPELAPMRDDPPLTPDSVALAKRVQADDRAQATVDTGLQFDGDTPYVPLLQLPFLRSTASDQATRWELLQLLESGMAEDIARAMAARIHGEPWETVPPEERTALRYVAVGAMRSLLACWRREARRASVTAALEAITTECGAVFSAMPDGRRLAIAEAVERAVRVASQGILEGSQHLPPGRYLRIVDGEQQR